MLLRHPVAKSSLGTKSYHFSSIDIALFFNLYFGNKVKLSKKQKALISKEGVHEFYKWVFFPEKFDYKKFDVKWLTLLTFENNGIKPISKTKIPTLKKALVKFLKKDYHEELSEIYWTYFT